MLLDEFDHPLWLGAAQFSQHPPGPGLGEALALGARCGAACLTGRGPYERQLREA